MPAHFNVKKIQTMRNAFEMSFERKENNVILDLKNKNKNKYIIKVQKALDLM